MYGKGRPGVIRGMDMHASVYDEHIIPIENLNNPRALDFHTETEFIYFADATSYIIGRQKIDGTERDIIVKDGECRMMLFFVGVTLNVDKLDVQLLNLSLSSPSHSFCLYIPQVFTL